MTTPTIELVRTFIEMWAQPNGIDRAVKEYFTDRTVWENHGLVTTTGIEEALGVNQHFVDKIGMARIVVDIDAIAQDGNKVLTERVDRILDAQDGTIMAAPTLGIFEVEDGKIVAWRDYFDSKEALEAQAD